MSAVSSRLSVTYIIHASKDRTSVETSCRRHNGAERHQIEFQQMCLDDLLAADHRARQVWSYVEGLDLSAFYERVRTTKASSGRPAIDPAILTALWLYATLEGVGSARLLDRLCETDLAYRWLRGGVSVNYHTLADFRTEAGPILDDLLSRSVAGLIVAGIVDLETVAVDGMRLQATASGASFRSGGRLDELSEAASATVHRLRTEMNDDPAIASRRVKARRLSGAEDRARRLEEARRAHAEIDQRRKKAWGVQKPARASTTDPQARFMKMSDGGFRPAYNVQVKTAATNAYIIGISVTNRGTDHRELGPALHEIEKRYGQCPRQMLADGGFESGADLEMLHAQGIDLFSPLRRSPVASRPSDGPGMTAWRRRMASAEGQAIYRRRIATERPHADMRNRGLRRLMVRGLEKAKAVVLWYAHAYNFLQITRSALA
jgi:transposase